MDYCWKNEYKLNINIIDEQHKSLFDAIEDLEKLINSEGNQSHAVDALLALLIHYTDYHFKAEEQLLEKIGYPDLPQHCQLHKELKNSVLNFLQEQKEKTLDVNNFLVFLRYWLVKHILVEDRKYANFLQKKGQNLGNISL